MDACRKRYFRINTHVLEKHVPTMGCKGCEAKMNDSDARQHATECEARSEEVISLGEAQKE